MSQEALNHLLATDPIRWVSAVLKMIVYLSMMSWVVNSEELWERIGFSE